MNDCRDCYMNIVNIISLVFGDDEFIGEFNPRR